VPAGERQRVGDRHHQVVAEAGIDAAELDLAPLDEHPDPHPPPQRREVEAGHHPPVGQQVALQELLAPRPEDDAGVGMLGRDRDLPGASSAVQGGI
jgi:hypothetical protein